MARPTIYTQELAESICVRLAEGEPLVKICRDDIMPGTTTVYRWLAASDPFRDMYARAREDQADTLADQIIEIADDGSNDTYTKDGVELANQDVVARSKLRVDARKWIAAKLKPRKYGEYTRQEHSGPDGGPIAFALPSYDELRAEIERRRRPAS